MLENPFKEILYVFLEILRSNTYPYVRNKLSINKQLTCHKC